MIALHTISLSNFRCYRKIQFSFSPGINIIVGDNAVGKTTVAEAVHCLALGKSHRTSSDTDMIRSGEDYAAVSGTFTKDGKTEDITFALTKSGKRMIRNGVKIPKISDYIGYINIVLFCPEDLDIVKGNPAARRKFLDISISQMNSHYLRTSMRYKRLLKERNEILKSAGSSGKYDQVLLNVITDELINEARGIIGDRKDFISRINPFFSENIRAISEAQDDAEMIYYPNADADNLRKVMQERIKADFIGKTTTSGPHRDDFQIAISRRAASGFSSQGQQRTFALAAKLALADMIRKNGNDVIVILDDVFSELDCSRQNQILKLLKENSQIIITTTSIGNLSEEVLKRSNIITINKEEEDERENN